MSKGTGSTGIPTRTMRPPGAGAPEILVGRGGTGGFEDDLRAPAAGFGAHAVAEVLLRGVDRDDALHPLQQPQLLGLDIADVDAAGAAGAGGDRGHDADGAGSDHGG